MTISDADKLVQRNLWVHSPRPEFALDEIPCGDEFYIPARALPLISRGDYVIVPKTPVVVDFVKFILSELSDIEPHQILYTSGKSFLLDTDIKAELLPQLHQIIRPKTEVMPSWKIVPYSITVEFHSWVDNLPGVTVFGDTEKFINSHGNKSILHPRFHAQKVESNNPSTVRNLWETIRLPGGYTCCDLEELNAAYRSLRADGFDELLLKPIVGSAGEGIEDATPDRVEHYDFRYGPVVLEEKVPIDRDHNGDELSCSIQFFGKRILGKITDQLVCGNTWVGNMVPSAQSHEFQQECFDITNKVVELLHFYGMTGPGGLDFLVSEGKPLLVDVNLGRFTGCHPPKLFIEKYVTEDTPFLTWKLPNSYSRSVDEVWTLLGKNNLRFVPSSSNHKDTYTKGVFPLCYLSGVFMLLIAIAPTREELITIRKRVKDLLNV